MRQTNHPKGLSHLKEKLPTTYYATAKELCEVFGLTCPDIFADKQVGIPVSGLKRLMDAAGESSVIVDLGAHIPAILPTAELVESRSSRKSDKQKHWQAQMDLWIETHQDMFRLLFIQCEHFECYVSVKALSGTGLPYKYKKGRK